MSTGAARRGHTEALFISKANALNGTQLTLKQILGEAKLFKFKNHRKLGLILFLITNHARQSN